MEKTNYYREMQAVTERLGETKPKLLLQSCCGPCSTSTLECLLHYFDVTVLYYNPNIQPREEYDLRLKNQKTVLEKLGVKQMPCDYEGEMFTKAVSGFEQEPEGGRRCTICFNLRMEKAACLAKENGFDYFCTTLTVSPHKDAERINRIGKALEEKYGVKWLPSDFKKKDGYLRSIRMSKEMGLYRQEYCGCLYSKPQKEKTENEDYGN